MESIASLILLYAALRTERWLTRRYAQVLFPQLDVLDCVEQGELIRKHSRAPWWMAALAVVFVFPGTEAVMWGARALGVRRSLFSAVANACVVLVFGIACFLASRRAIRVGMREELARRGRCVSCGYDLTGNTSGVCPECGEATTNSVASVCSCSDQQEKTEGTEKG